MPGFTTPSLTVPISTPSAPGVGAIGGAAASSYGVAPMGIDINWDSVKGKVAAGLQAYSMWKSMQPDPKQDEQAAANARNNVLGGLKTPSFEPQWNM